MHNSIIPFYKQNDIHITKAKDCYMFDSEDKQYIDFESGDWAANLGHSNEIINQVLKHQSDLLIHDGLKFRNRESEELSLRLLEKLNLKNGKSAFVNSGSEAVNLGITLAKHLSGREKVLKLDCSYLSAYGHGQSSLNNQDLINIPFDNLEALDKFDFSDIAVFVFEPGNSSGLIKYPDSDFVRVLASKVKQSGGFLMANEVTTGFGRTGKWFGFQHYNFQPDIVSVGKALGNGYPISGVSVSSEVSGLFDKTPFRYAQSHQNDALGCAIGLAVIKYIESNNIISQAYDKGVFFENRLLELETKHTGIITDIRARGLMIGMEFNTIENANLLSELLLAKGYITGIKEKTIRFMPPLIIPQTYINELINTIDSLL